MYRNTSLSFSSVVDSTNENSSDHESEILALDKPLLSGSCAIGSCVGHQDECFAEAALRLIAAFAIPDMPAHQNQDRHVLGLHLRSRFNPVGLGGGVCAVDDLAVKGLDLIVRFGHLALEYILNGRSSGDGVAIQQERGRGWVVESADAVAIRFEGLVICLDEIVGS